MQRLEVLVAVMLARERRSSTDDAVDGCTELAAALATLPSGLLEMIAEAVAALGCADEIQRCWRLYEFFCRASNGPDLLIRHVSSIWYS